MRNFLQGLIALVVFVLLVCLMAHLLLLGWLAQMDEAEALGRAWSSGSEVAMSMEDCR